MQQEILNGRVAQTLARLAWPLCITMLLSDGGLVVVNFWTARIAGTEGLAVVGLMLPVELIVGLLFLAVATGAGSLVARKVGAGQPSLSLIYGAAAFAALLGTALAALALLLLGPLAGALEGGASVLPQVRWYLLLYAMGLPVLAVWTVLLEVIDAAGWVRFGLLREVSFLVLLAAAVPALRFLGVGAAPAATALVTLLVGGWLAVVVHRRRVELGFGERDSNTRMVSGALWAELLVIGFPPQLARVVFVGVMLVLVQRISRGGAADAAGFIVAFQFVALVQCFTRAVAVANAIMVGQNVGASQRSRAREAIRSAAWISLLVSCAGLLALFFGGRAAALFTGDPAVLDAAARALRIMALAIPAVGVWQLMLNCHVALGATKVASAALVAMDGVSLLLVAVLPYPPLESACIALTVGHLLKAVAVGASYWARLRPTLGA